MSELFRKVTAHRLPDGVVAAQGGDKRLIEAVKRQLDERLLQQAKEIGWRNRMPRK